jgi:hypothetical protein
MATPISSLRRPHGGLRAARVRLEDRRAQVPVRSPHREFAVHAQSADQLYNTAVDRKQGVDAMKDAVTR